MFLKSGSETSEERQNVFEDDPSQTTHELLIP